MSKEKFNELGLTFKTLTPSDFDEISKFQMLYFFPDEPIARSTKLLEGSGIINKYISSLVKKYLIDPCLKDEVSVAAYNKDQWYTRISAFRPKRKVFSFRPSVSAAEIKG